jgi:hypothetical protein
MKGLDLLPCLMVLGEAVGPRLTGLFECEDLWRGSTRLHQRTFCVSELRCVPVVSLSYDPSSPFRAVTLVKVP